MYSAAIRVHDVDVRVNVDVGDAAVGPNRRIRRTWPPAGGQLAPIPTSEIHCVDLVVDLDDDSLRVRCPLRCAEVVVGRILAIKQQSPLMRSVGVHHHERVVSDIGWQDSPVDEAFLVASGAQPPREST